MCLQAIIGNKMSNCFGCCCLFLNITFISFFQPTSLYSYFLKYGVLCGEEQIFIVKIINKKNVNRLG
jgi:hypothetical protein